MSSKKRVISKETKSTGLIQFRLDPKAPNGGLSLGYLDKVKVTEAEYKADSKVELFRGTKVPRLNFVFRGLESGSNNPTYIHAFNAYDVTNESTEEKAWDSLSQTVKHFAEVLKGSELTDDEYKLLVLDYKDDSREEVVKGFTTFFNNIVLLFEGGKVGNKTYPSLIRKDDKKIKLWLKLLLYLNGKEVNQGNPGMPFYPGEGLIEVFVDRIQPKLRIRIEKGEDIEAKKRVVRPAVPILGMEGNAGSPAPNAPSSSMPSWMGGN